MIIEIISSENGAHQMQTYCGFIPNGWAYIPKNIKIPDSAPYVDIETEIHEGISYVTKMYPRDKPEPEPIKEPEPTAEKIIDVLLGV